MPTTRKTKGFFPYILGDEAAFQKYLRPFKLKRVRRKFESRILPRKRETKAKKKKGLSEEEYERIVEEFKIEYEKVQQHELIVEEC